MVNVSPAFSHSNRKLSFERFSSHYLVGPWDGGLYNCGCFDVFFKQRRHW